MADIEEGLRVDTRVVLDISASDEEVDVVRRVLLDANIDAEVEATYVRKSAGELPWIVIITGPVTVFLSAVAAAAGSDAYGAVKNLVRELWAARRRFSGSRGNVMLRDEQTGIWILLEPELPEDAYAKLAALNLSGFKGGQLKYDRERGEWTS